MLQVEGVNHCELVVALMHLTSDNVLLAKYKSCLTLDIYLKLNHSYANLSAVSLEMLHCRWVWSNTDRMSNEVLCKYHLIFRNNSRDNQMHFVLSYHGDVRKPPAWSLLNKWCSQRKHVSINTTSVTTARTLQFERQDASCLFSYVRTATSPVLPWYFFLFSIFFYLE